MLTAFTDFKIYFMKLLQNNVINIVTFPKIILLLYILLI